LLGGEGVDTNVIKNTAEVLIQTSKQIDLEGSVKLNLSAIAIITAKLCRN